MIYIKKNPEYGQILDIIMIKKCLRSALRQLSQPVTSDMTIVFTGDRQIQGLNLEYLQKDSPTDVLSFFSGEINPENGHVYLGDIIISVPQAVQQAQKSGLPVSNEIYLLLIHGLLHLLGHNHANQTEKAEMWSIQNKILDQLGYPNHTATDD